MGGSAHGRPANTNLMDTLSPAARSVRMSKIRSKNSHPEMTVRRLVHKMGYRFRLHAVDLPGKPDIVFRSRRKVIFVHGCFWHRHPDPDCKLARLPKSKLDFWVPKLTANSERYRVAIEGLERMGWESLVVWECESRHIEQLENRLRAFLEGEKGDNAGY